jgi:two-component system sensor histidine kinase EvgS
MSESFQEKIFETFSQQEGQSVKKYGGTGLGLSITKKLVELMNGTISVKSKSNQGTTIKVVIPNIVASEEFEQRLVTPKIDFEDLKFLSATILIADDVVYNRDYVKGILRETEIVILEAENGALALNLLKTNKVDLIITDIKMPVMDGFELLKNIKNDNTLKNIPVLASTAAVMKKEQEVLKNKGFSGYVVKPFEINDLYEELIKFLKYTLINETSDNNNIDVIISNSISDDDKIKLLQALENDHKNIWEGFAEQQPMDEVQEFANNLLKTATKYPHHLVIAYANKLNEAVDGFDIYNLLKYLKQFPQLIENIRNS